MLLKKLNLLNLNYFKPNILACYRKYIHGSETRVSSFLTEGDGLDIDELNKNDSEYEELVKRCFDGNNYHNCFIIHPYVKWGHKKIRDTNPQLRLEEAVSLVKTLDQWTVADLSIVSLDNLEKKTLFGKGKLKELVTTVRKNPKITAVFINKGTLKNMQLDEMEKLFQLPVYDRYKIIMQILRFHAISKHAKLQVALAEISFLRRRYQFTDDDKHKAASKETKKLLFHHREQQIKQAIEKLRSQRLLLRKRRSRNSFPIIAVVGYTNSGKTSLIKALTSDEALKPRNQLFATLDVTLHAGRLPSNLEVLYVDTVGFISDIPTNLIECFIATLEDALLADVIIHVEDLSNNELLHQRNHVDTTLNTLAKQVDMPDIMDKVITVGNKIDKANDAVLKANSNFQISCTKLIGIQDLKIAIENAILKNTDRLKVDIKTNTGGDELRWLYKNAAVVNTTVDSSDAQKQIVQVIITKAKLHQFKYQFITTK